MKRVVVVLIFFPLLLNAQGISTLQKQKLDLALRAISSLYVDSIDDKKVVENTIVAVLKELDPHSAYIPKEEVERVQEPLKGSFEGVGIQFQMLEDTLLVVQTISGCPAEKVGILPGDRMIYIEDELIAGVKMQNTQIMERLRGPKGTVVNVRMKRRGVQDLLLFKITRDKIPLYTVDASYMVDNKIGYIKINNFGSTTVNEYKEAVSKLQEQGMKDLILNLQSNGGGYLLAAIELCDQFLNDGQLIVYTEGLHQRKQEAAATHRGNFMNGRLIVLVDEYSASASEITAGAIQDWDRGILVGRRTFGKGLVQRELALNDGSLMRLTTARYYTPTGRSIQKPYKDGVNYEEDLMNRYKHGEFSNADSIHFPDSLQYKTLRLERTVYGGGGIMPDVFVPLDTTKYTAYHRKIVAQGVLNKTGMQYIQDNRQQLKSDYPTFEFFKAEYAVPESLLEQLIAEGEKEDIAFNEEEFEKSKSLISLQLKALTARDLWDTNEYYRIIDEENESLKRAVEILQSKNEYKNILKKP